MREKHHEMFQFHIVPIRESLLLRPRDKLAEQCGVGFRRVVRLPALVAQVLEKIFNQSLHDKSPRSCRRKSLLPQADLFDSPSAFSTITAVFTSEKIDFTGKAAGYGELEKQLRALLHGERDVVANLANAAALLWHTLPDLNWAGFYRPAGNQLVLGPFQGKPACVRIQLGKGVCGTAAATRQTVVVRDVHEFPGHIACDAASRSEIVVPLLKDGILLGVLDLDSPRPNRFDAQDQAGLEQLAAMLIAATAWD